MTVRELDRLVTRTEMTPIAKKGLRHVRKAVMTGKAGSHEVGTATWSVCIDNDSNSGMRVSFSFKRD